MPFRNLEGCIIREAAEERIIARQGRAFVELNVGVPSLAVLPVMVMACAVEDCMDMQSFSDDGKEDAVRKAFDEHAAHAVAWARDSELLGSFLRTADGADDFVQNFGTEAGALLLIPHDRAGDVFHRERPDDDPLNH